MVFQVFGILSTNALISLNLLSPLFQLAGIFHFLTFLSIWYAVFLKEKKIPLSVMGKGFPQVYSSFLTIYYNSVVGSRLGEEAFGYTAFIRKSKIEDHLSIDRDKMTLRETEGFDIEELVNKNLAIFSRGHVGDEVIDHYLRVLNAAHQELGPRFDEIVKTNLDFLKNSDLIYGISGGEYLREVVEDESLKDLDDVEACLRIYRRILLPVASTIRGNTRLWEMFSENRIAETMKISDYGEVSINHQLIDRQAQDVIDRFNPILSRIYKEILVDTPTDSDDLLRSLRVVLTLNKDKAVALGIYPTLLGSLATKIPKTQIHRLYSGYLEELIEEKTRELRKTQESLLKSQRLAVIGEAAAMVGHDLRNPLQGIVNLLFLAEKKTTLLSADQNSITMDLRQILKTIGEQVGYMNKIVSDLQDYARPITAKLADTSMPQLLDEILSGIIVPENVRVSIDIEEGLPTLLLDPLLIKRVFTNLITNAIQAMPEGGQLTIEVSRLEEMLVIRFKDTGVGISEDNLDNLFQPLFTTKAKGQGLGLAVCKRLVEAIHGDITVESESGRGSTFIVRIPYRPKPLDKTVQHQYVLVIKE